MEPARQSDVVKMSYVDSQIQYSGTHRPLNPLHGECYHNLSDSKTYMYISGNWVELASGSTVFPTPPKICSYCRTERTAGCNCKNCGAP